MENYKLNKNLQSYFENLLLLSKYFEKSTNFFFRRYPLDATNPKIFWSIEDVIASTGWLPIEINVPDTISSISSGISGITGNILQRIPIINRITNPVKPRPFQYALIPVKIMTAPAQEQIRYDPFDSHSNHFPTFP